MSTPLTKPTTEGTPYSKVKILKSKSDVGLGASQQNQQDLAQPSRLPRQRFKSEYGRLSVHGEYNFGIPSMKAAQNHVEEHHGKDSWRMKVLGFLHQKKIQYTLMILLVFDVLILFLELLLLTQYPMCSVIKRDCISCCVDDPANNYNATDEAHNDLRLLGGGGSEHSEICEAGLQPEHGTGGCDPHKWQNVHTAELFLFSFTVIILSVFFIELNLEMLALRPSIFFRQFFFALDYFIITVSLAMELALHFMGDEALSTLLGLLVFTRIWRFVRIGHGIVEVTSELTHEKYEALMVYTAALQAAAKGKNIQLPDCPNSVEEALQEYASSSLDPTGTLPEEKPSAENPTL